MDAREARDHRDGRRAGAAHRRGGLVVLLALILLLAACGAEEPGDGGNGGGDAGEDGDAGRPGPGIELTITFWPEGREGEAREAVLICDPVGGTHRAADRACKLLRANQDALEGLPPDTICTQVYGGPEEAEVTGVVDGARVQSAFSRQNGCEIDRWDRLAAVLELEAPS
ncbi:MAG TPA: SSI family serine proteinase inhibitor [Gaiellaceae bacterium]|nr:SSI family serine proteinase inhibitor [Gaiellaceae bacterium]